MKLISKHFGEAGWFFETSGTFTIEFPDMDASVTYSSHRATLDGFEKPVVLGVDVVAEIETEDFYQGLQRVEALVSNYGATIAFVSNAASFGFSHIMTTTLEADDNQREFIASRVSFPEPSPLARRQVPTLALYNVLERLLHYPRVERLSRVIAQYVQAIMNWGPGSETLVLAHGWMAVEALTPIVRDKTYADLGLANAQEYADHHNIELRRVDGHVREHHILSGNTELYNAARNASDGLEHGFGAFHEINQVARDHSFALLTEIRRTVFDILEVDQNFRTELMSDPYNVPYCLKHVKFLQGRLVGDATRDELRQLTPVWEIGFTEVSSERPDANIQSNDTFRLEPQGGLGIGECNPGIRDYNERRE